MNHVMLYFEKYCYEKISFQGRENLGVGFISYLWHPPGFQPVLG
jgi:hypothetical protein